MPTNTDTITVTISKAAESALATLATGIVTRSVKSLDADHKDAKTIVAAMAKVDGYTYDMLATKTGIAKTTVFNIVSAGKLTTKRLGQYKAAGKRCVSLSGFVAWDKLADESGDVPENGTTTTAWTVKVIERIERADDADELDEIIKAAQARKVALRKAAKSAK
jgi:hypothetical protein